MQSYRKGILKFVIEEARLTRQVTTFTNQEPYVVCFNQDGEELCRTEVCQDSPIVCKFDTTCEIEIKDRKIDDLQIDNPEIAEVIEDEKDKEEEERAKEDIEAAIPLKPLEPHRYTVDSSVMFKVYHRGITGETLIGFAPVNLSSLIVNAEKPVENRDWHSVFFNCERVGHLQILSSFKPADKDGIQPGIDKKPADFRYLEMIRTHEKLNQKRSEEKKKHDELEKRMKAVKKEYDQL